jgi:hypothetical protein
LHPWTTNWTGFRCLELDLCMCPLSCHYYVEVTSLLAIFVIFKARAGFYVYYIPQSQWEIFLIETMYTWRLVYIDWPGLLLLLVIWASMEVVALSWGSPSVGGNPGSHYSTALITMIGLSPLEKHNL